MASGEPMRDFGFNTTSTPRFGPDRPNNVRHRLKFVESQSVWADTGPNPSEEWPSSGPIRSNSSKCGRIQAKLHYVAQSKFKTDCLPASLCRPNLADTGPHVAEFGSKLIDPWPILAECDQSRAEFGRDRALQLKDRHVGVQVVPLVGEQLAGRCAENAARQLLAVCLHAGESNGDGDLQRHTSLARGGE